jgi:hypothetical protein
MESDVYILTAYRGIASTTDKVNRLDNIPVDTGATI